MSPVRFGFLLFHKSSCNCYSVSMSLMHRLCPRLSVGSLQGRRLGGQQGTVPGSPPIRFTVVKVPVFITPRFELGHWCTLRVPVQSLDKGGGRRGGRRG